MIQEFMQWANSNQLIAGALSLWGLGTITYLAKNIPEKIWICIKRQLTTEMALTSRHVAFHELMDWLSRNGPKNIRSVKINNGRYGYETDGCIRSIGYGNHYMKLFGSWMRLSLMQDNATTSDIERDRLTITKLGRDHTAFDELFKAFSVSSLSADYVDTYYFGSHSWYKAQSQPRRSIDTLYLNEGVMEKIVGTIDNFLKSEKWYLDNGIPYQLGIMLWGYPGTGKTSIIKALAALFNKKVYSLDPDHIMSLTEAVREMSRDSLLVIEDIDSSRVTHSRKRGEVTENTPVMPQIQDLTSISSVLNSLDGFNTTHGRILIITTNRPEVLDAALIRPGRIDLSQEIGYMDQYAFNKFISRFYSKTTDRIVKEGITVAQLQNKVMQGVTFDEILINFTEENRYGGKGR